MSRLSATLALAIALETALCGRAAGALGEAPPALDAKEWIGRPLDWEERRGKVVVLAFIEPDVAASKQAIEEVADMLKADAKNGLEVCFVSQASRPAVEAYLARQKSHLSCPVAIDPGTIRAYFKTTLTPFAAVIDRDGKIVFEGPWGERVQMALAVKAALERPRTVVRARTSPRFAEAWKALDAKDTRAAVSELKRIEADGEPKDRDDAAALLAKLEIEAKKKLGEADRSFAADEFLDAVEAYESIAFAYEGLDSAKKAAEAAKHMRSDPKTKKELEAGAAIREARALEKAGKAREAASKYRSIASKWKGTKSAEIAKKRAEELEKRR
jgi:hypothetical protein